MCLVLWLQFLRFGTRMETVREEDILSVKQWNQCQRNIDDFNSKSSCTERKEMSRKKTTNLKKC